jgi:hypothetical protein
VALDQVGLARAVLCSPFPNDAMAAGTIPVSCIAMDLGRNITTTTFEVDIVQDKPI